MSEPVIVNVVTAVIADIVSVLLTPVVEDNPVPGDHVHLVQDQDLSSPPRIVMFAIPDAAIQVVTVSTESITVPFTTN